MATLRDRAGRASSARLALLAWVVALLGWSASTLFVRAAHTNALVYSTWRLWMAVPPLGIFVLVRRRRGHQSPLQTPGVTRRVWALVIVGAGALFVAGMVTTFAAINKTSLLDVTLIGSLQPVLIVGFAVAFLGERARTSYLVRGVIAIGGALLVAVSSSSGHGALAGDMLAVISLVLGAAWFLYGRVLRDRFGVDPVGLMFGVFGSGAVLMTVFTLIVNGSLRIGAAALGYAAATMVCGTTGHVLVVWAHRYLPTSVSAPLLLAEPPIVGLAAWACFGQQPGALAAVGSVVVLGALWGVVRSPAVEHVEDELPDPGPPT
jgi:drug/metabolite transporter (DMT)-like permease